MRRIAAAALTVVGAIGLITGPQLLAQAPHPAPGPCDAGAGVGARACRTFYRGRLITQYEREQIERAGSGGAVVTADGIFLFDTSAEVDRFDAGRTAAVR